MDRRLPNALYCCLLLGATASAYDEASRVKEELFRTYNRFVPPFSDQSLDLTLHFALWRIEEFDELQGVFAVDIAVIMTWKDSRLVWNGSVDAFTILPERVWLPTLFLFNRRFEHRGHVGEVPFLTVSRDGLVEATLPTLATVHCQPELRYFPKGQQECRLIFGSLSVPADDMHVLHHPDMKDIMLFDNKLRKRPKWRILSVRMNAENQTLEYGEVRPVEVVTVTFKRNTPLLLLVLVTILFVCATTCTLAYWAWSPLVRLGLACSSFCLSVQLLEKIVLMLPHSPRTTPIVVQLGATCSALCVLAACHTVVLTKWSTPIVDRTGYWLHLTVLLTSAFFAIIMP